MCLGLGLDSMLFIQRPYLAGQWLLFCQARPPEVIKYTKNNIQDGLEKNTQAELTVNEQQRDWAVRTA